MGPEGGNGGGRIVAQGTPEAIAANAASHTGHYLGKVLSRNKKT
jgi:excinuclease ABC subunit A